MLGFGDEALIVALGSAGAFTTMVECIPARLKRDKSRRIDVRWDEDATERYVTFRGDAVDTEAIGAHTTQDHDLSATN